ncbi:MAG: hypothetical protein ACFCU8_07260 [Thermosynechococcaceae cyanobacterium]
MTSSAGVMLTQDSLSQFDDSNSMIVEQFRAQLLSAKRSMHQNYPWVVVAPIGKAATLMSVYNTLKTQGLFDDWSGEFFNLRQDSGACVLALMP